MRSGRPSRSLAAPPLADDLGYSWEIVGPGACIVLVVLAFNSLGDALREILETRIRSR